MNEYCSILFNKMNIHPNANESLRQGTSFDIVQNLLFRTSVVVLILNRINIKYV